MAVPVVRKINAFLQPCLLAHGLVLHCARHPASLVSVVGIPVLTFHVRFQFHHLWHDSQLEQICNASVTNNMRHKIDDVSTRDGCPGKIPHLDACTLPFVLDLHGLVILLAGLLHDVLSLG